MVSEKVVCRRCVEGKTWPFTDSCHFHRESSLLNISGKILETPCLVIKIGFLTENYDDECTAPTVDIFTFAV